MTAMGPRLENMVEPVLRLVKKRSEKAGLPPGAPVFVGEKKAEEFAIDVLDYGPEGAVRREGVSVAECAAYREAPTVTWINAVGLHDTAKVEELCGQFALHPLTVEDILNTGQRPKMDVFDDYIFIVLKMPREKTSDDGLDVENISIVLGNRFVLTFQERPGDVFGPVRSRILKRGRITAQGADYLAYALMDVIVDGYFALIENIGERVEDIEEEVVSRPEPDTVKDIHLMKRRLIELRRAVWPLREVISGLDRTESKLVAKPTRVYLRDLYDHTIQVIETVETQRDLVSGMLDIYLSSLSNRLNEVMKVLTIFATIFIPLTFIAGVYGMNFRNIPETRWQYGYYYALGLMAIVGISLYRYFKRKKWF